MIISLKKVDDRPKILWRYSLTEPADIPECKMRNTPIEYFICTQIDQCKYQCTQKIEQKQRPEYVHEQQLKMLIKIEHISHNNGYNNRNR